MSYLRKIHELRCQGGEEAVVRYERIQEYVGIIAECEEEIEYCKRAIEMIEKGQDPDEIQEQEKDEMPF
jgi:hypothetical protein